jgi:hypothetical protein
MGAHDRTRRACMIEMNVRQQDLADVVPSDPL